MQDHNSCSWNRNQDKLSDEAAPGYCVAIGNDDYPAILPSREVRLGWLTAGSINEANLILTEQVRGDLSCYTQHSLSH